MKTKTFAFLLLLSITFSGCSWSEYFMVSNLSDQSIFVNYAITAPQGHNFGIFEPSPTFYSATKNGKIDWNHKIEVKDSDERDEVVSIYLPAKSIMVFGSLQNDNYESYDQSFINSREFNLDYISIEVNSQVFHTSKKHFDKEFKKEDGHIKLEVK